MTRNVQLAINDLLDGIRSIHIWPVLGWQEVKQRYRRSTLGPFWLTISTGVLLAVMGPLYGKLFNQDIGSYFLFLAVGYIAWQFFSQLVADACTVFIASEGYIKQVRLPLTIYVLRVTWKNLIVFFHNMIVAVAVVAYFRPPLGLDLLLVPIAIVFYGLNGLWFGTILGVVCARFRDIPQIVSNVVQIFFFVTPIMWQPGMLGRHAWVVDLNPFYHFLEILRGPLIGAPLNLVSWGAVIGITILGFGTMIPFFSRYRARIAYWV
jgi:ABC-type polysaccharide/polyol phosphate export permease